MPIEVELKARITDPATVVPDDEKVRARFGSHHFGLSNGSFFGTVSGCGAAGDANFQSRAGLNRSCRATSVRFQVGGPDHLPPLLHIAPDQRR